MAFTDDLFVLATGPRDSEQEMEGLCLFLGFAPRAAQDLQQSENPSVLHELHEVLITEECEKNVCHRQKRAMHRYGSLE